MAPPLVHVFSSLVLLVTCSAIGCYANFYRDVEITWGAGGHAKILNNGELLTLTLDTASGSAFRSKNQFLFGIISMQIKLIPGDSAGIVTTFYLRSEGAAWDEIDLEFLGNVSSDPYVLHTNVYTRAKGGREQEFYLWFDPRADFHTYSVLWNPQCIIISVDGIPVREFKNLESRGVPFPKTQPMRVQSSIWNADDWATRGGRVKTDWSKAPFTASFRNFDATSACVRSSGASYCGAAPGNKSSWLYKKLDAAGQRRLAWVRKNYMIYDYCADTKKFPQGIRPLECRTN